MPRRKIDFEQIRKMRDAKGEKKSKRPPFAMIPLHWLLMVFEAEAQNGLTLLAAIAYRMNNRSRVVIDDETWELAGRPRTKAKKHAMLVALKRVRHIVELDYSPRLGQPKYTAYKGIWWDTAPDLAAVAAAELKAAARPRPVDLQ
jgi:hypothetical protein